MSTDTEYANPTTDYLRSQLQDMDPYEFEQLVGDVWERLGWETNVVGKPGDRGIDVIGTTEEKKTVIQATNKAGLNLLGFPAKLTPNSKSCIRHKMVSLKPIRKTPILILKVY